MGAEDRLQELLDYHDIRNLLAEYCHGCDRLDFAEMAGTYLEDSWDDHGPRKMPGKAFARATILDAEAISNMCNHNLGQSSIKLNGDEAGAETYFIANLRANGKAGGEVLRQIGGRYIDQLQRTAEGWKVKHRICLRDWSFEIKIEDWLAGMGFAEGGRTGDDPSYAVLGRRHSGPPV